MTKYWSDETAYHDLTVVFQPLDADLTSLAALTATGGFAKRTAADTWVISVAGNALTAATADAPAGGTGAAAGGWSSAANRNTAIALINNLKTRVGEIEARLKAHGLID